MDTDELIKNTDVEKIVTEGTEIYQAIKNKYEPKENGKFLAIDISSRDAYLSETSAQAVMNAKKDHPNNIFYVVKVGSDAAETISHLFHK
jgi:hypothetical protein